MVSDLYYVQDYIFMIFVLDWNLYVSGSERFVLVGILVLIYF